MSASLKTILDAVMGESGLLVPTNYASSANPDDHQLIYLANAAADEIRDAGYQTLVKSGSIALTTATDYPLPVDFHSYVPDTAYQAGRTYPADLPTSPSDWAIRRAGAGTTFTLSVRFIGDRLHIQDPVDGEVLLFEYISNSPFTDSGGTPKEAATMDNDIWLLDRRLLIMATKWRFKKEKGLPDWNADLQLFTRYANGLRGRDSGSKTLYMGPVSSPYGNEPYTNLWVT